MALVGSENYLLLLTIILGLVAFAFWTERNSLASKIPGVVWILVLSIALSNTGVLPYHSPVYDFIGGTIMPLAIPLLLYKATFSKVIRESGMILPIFLIGSVAVCIGAFIGYYVLDLGPMGAQVTATYAAAWIGGMVNFVALSQITQMTPSEFTIAVSASAPVSIMGLAILAGLPSIPFVRRHIPSKIISEQDAVATKPTMQAEGIPFRLPHVAGALALSAAICVVGTMLATQFGILNYSLFIITLLTVALANMFPRSLGALEGDFEIGMFAMYLFFAVIGASTDALSFITTAPIFFLLGAIIILVHITLVLLCAKLLKFDLAEAIIGSGANIVGAAPAAGIASSKGWQTLVTPAIATGMLGYAMANFLGILIYDILK